MTVATTAPIPALHHFAALARRPAADDASLVRAWLQPGEAPFLFSRAAWALRAIADARATQAGRQPVVWLPDYFCDQATGPLRASATLVFYPVDEQLQPDWPACEALADRRPDLFVLVHYFGRPADAATAHAFCKTSDALLVEDAAHVLAPDDSIGRIGEATIWSLYKHVPLPDGGLLTVRDGTGLDSRAVAAAARRLGDRAPAACRWLGKRLIQRVAAPVAARLRGAAPAFDDDPAPAPVAATPAMSGEARRLLRILQREIDGIAERRRANEQAVRRALAATDLRPLFGSPDGRWTPYRAAFRAADPERARYWYGRINDSGSVAESWPDLPPEVRRDPERHRVALALRATVLTIPVHADRTPDELFRAYDVAS